MTSSLEAILNNPTPRAPSRFPAQAVAAAASAKTPKVDAEGLQDFEVGLDIIRREQSKPSAGGS